MKLTKQDIDKVRNIEGFPVSSDEHIINLSNPSCYTVCPNPFITEFIENNGSMYDENKDKYDRTPFAADVSEGKSDPIYNAHSYHTKVPHKAIMRYILHYTDPGDIVLDGFCGTGMTGIAAQLCENPDKVFALKLENEMPNIKWGARKAVLNDISPTATMIAYNYNNKYDEVLFKKKANLILEGYMKEYDWMNQTKHIEDNKSFQLNTFMDDIAHINYTIWADVLICPNCSSEISFWDSAVDIEANKVKETFVCEKCGVELKKKDCERSFNIYYDRGLNETITTAKQVPVLINYTFNGKRYDKKPDEFDLDVIKKIEDIKIEHWYPTDRMCEGKESRRNDKFGITHVHHFFTKRNIVAISYILNSIKEEDIDFRLFMLGVIKSSLTYSTRMVKVNINRLLNGGGLFALGAVSGTLYVPSITAERPIIDAINNKVDSSLKVSRVINDYKKNIIISTGSTTNLPIGENSIDYIFTDPPFGDNLNYSELNFIWESWIKVFTNNKFEAVVNSAQNKGLYEYQELMTECFKEYYRVLKPNRWITVEFHNSKNAVWNAIQEGLNRAGFIIADVRTLDKKQGSFKQVTTTSAVKQDLVISAYKPKESFNREMFKNVGCEETAWTFAREHLEKLPVVVNRESKIEILKEREGFLLFDRMIAYHIVNGLAVPIDASDFYRGLDERFIKRDGMYFLPDQVNEYDNARIVSEIETVQFSLFVVDEKNAIAWLYKELEFPQTYAEIQPKFIQELRTIKHEKMPELSELLEENFIKNNEGRWYIPDPSKSGDIVKLREKRLIKEFEEYLNGKGKLKSFRTEAVRAGFAKLWKEKAYKNIVKVADRLPESVIQEDDKLLMYYDISLSRIE